MDRLLVSGYGVVLLYFHLLRRDIMHVRFNKAHGGPLVVVRCTVPLFNDT
jgi:hypothetical protein